MMPRTTSEAVAGILEVDATITLDPFIEVASHLVTEHCEPAGASATELELVERWLAAHFYRIRDQQPASERAGAVGQSFQHAVKVGFAVTMYGQQAMRLDSSGELAVLDKNVEEGRPGKVKGTWLGTYGNYRDELLAE